MRRYCCAFLLCLALADLLSAQTASDLEKQLQAQTGLERARTLATLTDALRQDNPKQAITYGTEALPLFAQHPDPPNHIRTLNEMAWAYMTLSDYPNAVAFAEKGRTLAEQHGDDRGQARAINNLGVIAQRRGDAVEAVERFAESLEIYRRLGSDLDISTSLNNLGFVYSTALADYETGLSYHVAALDVRERLGDKASIALSLNNIGIIYQRVGDLDRALNYFERALAIRRELGGDNRISGTLHNIGDVYFDKRDYAKALDYHTQALELRRTIGDRAAIASSLRNIGRIQTALGAPREARARLNEALQMAREAGDRTVVAQSHLGLALLDRDSGATAAAITHAKEALTIAEQIGALELTRQAWEELAASQERAGDFESALASFRKFHDVNARIFNAERSRRVELLERRYQLERREAEIAELQTRQAVDALRLGQQQNQRNFAIGAAAVFGLVGFGLYRRRVEASRIAERLSVTDALTGLKNRRYVLQTIETDMAASLRTHRAAASGQLPPNGDLVFLMIDIDHFKAVNDQFGHEAGDKVLVQMADVLRNSCRSSDTLARWGGEEFLVICRFTNRDTAATSAERIRAAVQEHLFDIGSGRTLHRTCSIGFATYPFLPKLADAMSWEQVVALADDALYLAKQSGRNTWLGVFEGDGESAPLRNEPGQDDLRQWIADRRVRIESAKSMQPSTHGQGPSVNLIQGTTLQA